MSSEELVVAGTGEIVDLGNAPQCASALLAIREMESQLREMKGILTQAIVDECARRGSKTLHFSEGSTATVSGGTEAVWDIEVLTQLLDAGLPADRYAELVTEEVTYRVNASVAKSIAGANEEYAKVIDNARSLVEKPQYVSIKHR
jgi:hypothetical protein